MAQVGAGWFTLMTRFMVAAVQVRRFCLSDSSMIRYDLVRERRVKGANDTVG